MEQHESYPSGELELRVIQPDDEPGGNWISVPDQAMIDARLTPSARLYFFMLVRRATLGLKHDDDEIAAAIGINFRSITKLKLELVQYGYLVRRNGGFLVHVDGSGVE